MINPVGQLYYTYHRVREMVCFLHLVYFFTFPYAFYINGSGLLFTTEVNKFNPSKTRSGLLFIPEVNLFNPSKTGRKMVHQTSLLFCFIHGPLRGHLIFTRYPLTKFPFHHHITRHCKFSGRYLLE